MLLASQSVVAITNEYNLKRPPPPEASSEGWVKSGYTHYPVWPPKLKTQRSSFNVKTPKAGATGTVVRWDPQANEAVFA
ncbi:hypothetical protein CVT24_002971 [Panaeolus cyanescens]|uniref:Uncharacterized protein n=1 Tax=Panaeolus cyanescens TaxID=181874 RepID=A0A409W8U3_9AGAR|nr:hypothetical protein CVT24_002971 [Panaeolus cyanescens]